MRPVPGPVVRGFDPPAQDWLPGHRGVDLAAPVGSRVRAAASGRVSVAQVIAGRGVVTIVHGEARTTYEPVRASVRVGQRVDAGDVIGTVQAGHCAAGCLHFGLKRGDEYLDPLGGSDVRLLPGSAVALARRLAAARDAALAAGGFEGSGSGVLLNPVGGPIRRSDAASTRSSTSGGCTPASTCSGRSTAPRSGPPPTRWCARSPTTPPAATGW